MQFVVVAARCSYAVLKDQNAQSRCQEKKKKKGILTQAAVPVGSKSECETPAVAQDVLACLELFVCGRTGCDDCEYAYVRAFLVRACPSLGVCE